jgi:hypothetical protein
MQSHGSVPEPEEPEFALVMEAAKASGTLKGCLENPYVFRHLCEMAREDPEIRAGLVTVRSLLAAILG